MVFTLTREDTSKMLGISTRTVDRYIQSGKIRTKRDGKLIMLNRDDVDIIMNGAIPASVEKKYEVIEAKPLTVPVVSYDYREVQNEILRTLENIIKEKDALIQDLSFKL